MNYTSLFHVMTNIGDKISLFLNQDKYYFFTLEVASAQVNFRWPLTKKVKKNSFT